MYAEDAKWANYCGDSPWRPLLLLPLLLFFYDCRISVVVVAPRDLSARSSGTKSIYRSTTKVITATTTLGIFWKTKSKAKQKHNHICFYSRQVNPFGLMIEAISCGVSSLSVAKASQSAKVVGPASRIANDGACIRRRGWL